MDDGAFDTAHSQLVEVRSDGRPVRRSPLAGSVLMGIGLGGFVDGIVLHQLLQWHHMLTSTDDHRATTVAGLETNVLADGLFHVATWLFVLAGSSMLVRAWQAGHLAPPWSRHVGALLGGWGIFNLAEGIVNHRLLGIHHVRDDVADPTPWDLGFLALGLGLTIAGVTMVWLLHPRRAGTPA